MEFVENMTWKSWVGHHRHNHEFNNHQIWQGNSVNFFFLFSFISYVLVSFFKTLIHLSSVGEAAVSEDSYSWHLGLPVSDAFFVCSTVATKSAGYNHVCIYVYPHLCSVSHISSLLDCLLLSWLPTSPPPPPPPSKKGKSRVLDQNGVSQAWF